MVIVLISDIHYGDKYYIDGEFTENVLSKNYLNTFIKEIKNIKPDLIIQLGDIVQSDNEVNDAIFLEEVATKFRSIESPVYHLIGNHDVANLSPSIWKKALGQSSTYYNAEHGNYNFIFLDTNNPKNKTKPKITEEQFQWLKKTLQTIPKKTLIFGHHSLYNYNLEANYWFKKLKGQAYISNIDEFSQLIQVHADKVLGVFNGHLHAEYSGLQNGVPFHSLNAFIENVGNNIPEYTMSYYTLKIDEARKIYQINKA